MTKPSSTGLLAPGSADTADFSTAVTSGADITGSGTVSNLTVEGTIALDGTFTTGSFTDSGAVTVRSGSLTDSGVLKVSGTFAMTGGTASAANISTTGQVSLTGGSLSTNGYFGDNGSLSVAGSASVNAGSGLEIGDSAAGSLAVAGGGKVSAGAAAIGNAAGSSGTATVTGSGSALTVTGALQVGNAGTGALQVSGAAHVSAQSLTVAVASGIIASATASGTGSAITVSQSMVLGYAGAGTLGIAGGASLGIGSSMQLGVTSESSGTLTIDGIGTVATVARELADGAGGSGRATVSGGASLSVAGDIAVGIGYGAAAANGTLAIQSAGSVITPVMTIAYGYGTKGRVTVDGQNSQLAIASALYVGGNWGSAGGSGELDVSNAGSVSAAAALVWSTGTVVLSGGSLASTTTTNLGIISGNGALSALSADATQDIVNSGVITASGGRLTLTGAVTGIGTLGIAAGADLRINGAAAATQTVAFASGSGPATLELATPWLVSGTITGFASGDVIELLGVTATSLQYSNGVLTAIGSGGPGGTLRALATLSLSGSYTANSFTLTLDGLGDSLITAAPSTPATAITGSTVSDYLETHNFFAATSVWNTPIGTGHSYTSVAGLSSMLGGLSTWSGGNVAIYYAHVTDPLVPILYNANTWWNVAIGAWAQTGNSASVEQDILSSSSATNPVPGNPYSTQVAGEYWNSAQSGLPSSYDAWQQVSGQTLYAYIPVGATPPADSDGQTVIIQPDGTAIELYAPVVLSSGAWVSPMFSATNALTGLGTGAEDGRRASMIENYAGALRDTDVSAGTISHALAITVPGSMLATGFVGPALAFDSGSSDYTGTLPMGSRLALPSGLSLSSLNLQTSLGLELAQAAQSYGMFVVDRGGSGVSVVTQNAPTSAALANWSMAEQHDLNAIVQASRLVN